MSTASNTVLVIGAGGVSSVCVHKMAMNKDIFPNVHLASRTKSKCDAIAASVKERTGAYVATYEIDAEEVPAMVNLIKQVQPSLVVNLALCSGTQCDHGYDGTNADDDAEHCQQRAKQVAPDRRKRDANCLCNQHER